MKTKEFRGSWIFLAAAAVIIISAISISSSSCKKTETVTPQTLSLSTGSDIIDIGDSTSPSILGYSSMAHPNYQLDLVHSNLGWQTLFQNNNSLLQGRFTNFKPSIHFDQKNPQNTAIVCWVDLSTFNTGQPGRDGTGKCGPTNMGIKYDTISGVITPIPSTDTAWFVSTAGNTSAYGNGYVSHGTLNFRAITHPVDLYFTYGGQKQETTSTGVMTQ